MAMPMAPTPYWTPDLVRALPDDGRRHELAHGELLVTPAPEKRHQRILKRLLVELERWLEQYPVGEVFTSPADLTHGPDILLQPDLFVLSPAAAATPGWNELSDLLLAIEILSPSTARNDRFPKRRAYQEAGVPLYWLVDPDASRVEVWTPTDPYPRLETTRLIWHPPGVPPACEISLPPIFA
jgi:Uma2 family endonuclease